MCRGGHLRLEGGGAMKAYRSSPARGAGCSEVQKYGALCVGIVFIEEYATPSVNFLDDVANLSQICNKITMYEYINTIPSVL